VAVSSLTVEPQVPLRCSTYPNSPVYTQLADCASGFVESSMLRRMRTGRKLVCRDVAGVGSFAGIVINIDDTAAMRTDDRMACFVAEFAHRHAQSQVGGALGASHRGA
jgi:hypothetical protein